MTYSLWKLLHVVSVIAFLGNITTGLFWAAHAHRSRDFKLISSTFSGIIRSDRLFTVPGVFGILIGGFGAAISAGIPILRTGWIFWSLVLFAISGILFSAVVAPMQKKIAAFTSGQPSDDKSWAVYVGLYKRWEIWGLMAWITPVIAMILMILKRPLAGL